MSATEVLSQFKTQLITFFDELVSQFPEEGDLVIIRLFIDNQVPIKDVMDVFNHRINSNDYKLKKMIKERNEKFFLEHSVFDSLGKEKVLHFKKLWRSNLLDEEDREIIWNWIDAFVYLADKYIKIINKQ